MARKKRAAAKNISKFRVITTARVKDFLSRRPHRSFRQTKRRDYARSLKLPGYWGFATYVFRVLCDNKKSILIIGALYIIASVVLLGIGSQENFTQLREALSDASQEAVKGDWSQFGQTTVLALSIVAGAVSPDLNEAQQIYAVLLGLLMWLVIVWLLRQRLAGNQVRVRDALYNAGAPIVPMVAIFLVILLQLIPIALAVIAYTAAQTSGLLAHGVEAMLFWCTAAGLAAISLYWITGSVLALIVVTVPGLYPMRALRLAGDMAIGRRLRILYRLAWMIFLVIVAGIAVIVPMIMLDSGIKQLWPAIEWVPTIPIVISVWGAASLVWGSAYTYLLYRGIVDDDAEPA